MLESKKAIKIISSLVIGLSLGCVLTPIAQATSFTAPKLGTATQAPTNPAIKNAEKTSKKVAMGSTYTAKDVKKVNKKKIVRINKSQWLNTKDVVKD